MRDYSDEQIARVVHEANSALQRIQGDTVPSQPWDSEDEEIRQGVIANVRNARAGMTPRLLHEMWVRDKKARGWRYGPEKNPQARTHPCLVEYHELPDYQRDKNRLFIAIVSALAH